MEKMGSDCLMDMGFFLEVMKHSGISSDSCTTCEYSKNHWIVYLKRVDFMNYASIKKISRSGHIFPRITAGAIFSLFKKKKKGGRDVLPWQ